MVEKTGSNPYNFTVEIIKNNVYTCKSKKFLYVTYTKMNYMSLNLMTDSFFIYAFISLVY